VHAGTVQEVAVGAFKKFTWDQNKRRKVDTVKLTMDRQQALGPSCNIGDTQHKSAFQAFPGLAVQPLAAPHAVTAPDNASDTIDGVQPAALGHANAAQQQQPRRTRSQSQGGGQLQESAEQIAPMEAQRHEEDPVRADGQVAGRVASSSAAAADVRPPGDVAVLDGFRDMGEDAWKVFYMASKMGLRPDVIERAATRLRTLQRSSSS